MTIVNKTFHLSLSLIKYRALNFNRCSTSKIRYFSNMPEKNDFVHKRVNNILKSASDKRDYRYLVLKNELKVLLINDKTADKSAAAMDVHIGFMSDPDDLPGLAHFCEHMLFLGTEKYPEENGYQKFLQENGGCCNAFTSSDYTCYYFDVAVDKLRPALDLFAQFFLGPLFTKSATDREINAVDLENSKNLPNDMWRLDQLNKSTADPSHAYSKFGTGSKETLDTIPKQKGIDVRDELLKFHSTWYSSNIMSLVVLGKESLDELESMVGEMFGQIKNKEVVIPSWPESPYPPEAGYGGMKAYVVPVKDLRNLNISFTTSDIKENYKSSPESYLSHLIAHEGPGSLLSALKAKGWCNSLMGGEEYSVNGFDFFVIQVDLTEEAINHVDDVIKLVFQYINLLKKVGPIKWINDERKDILAMNFRFRDKEEPTNYVVSCARATQRYAPEDILSARRILTEWEPERITDLLDQLTPENMRVAIVGKAFEPICDQQEKWYGTKYKLEKISQECIDSWKNAEIPDNLELPPPNEFIPDSFELLPIESDNTEYPRIIKDTPYVRLWHKQDDEYFLPKLKTCIHLDSPIVYADPLNYNMTTIFSMLFNDFLDEYSYAASLVGLHWSLSNAKSGISLQIGGYNSKQLELLEKILEKLVSFKINKARFDIMKEIYARKLRNFKADQPYELAVYHLTTLLVENSWTKEELLKSIEDLTPERLSEFMPRLLASVHVECLVHGNTTKEQSLKVGALIEKMLPKTNPSLLPQQLLLDREVQLEKGSHFRLEVEYDVHTSSCALIYYQCGMQSTISNVLLQMLIQMISEPCYDVLRTKEQLGYIVNSGIRASYGVQGMRIIVQSDRHPVYVEQRVEAFLHHIKTVISNFSEDEFEKHRAALIAQRLKKPKTLFARSYIYWLEMISQQYNFNRLEVELDALKAITKQQVLDFHDRLISIDSPDRQKLCVHVISSALGGAGHEAYVEKTTDTENLLPVPEDSTKVSKIDDLIAFKSGRSLYPRINPYTNIPRRGAQCKL